MVFFGDLGKKYRDLCEPKSKIFDIKRAELEFKAKHTDPKAEFNATTKFDHSKVTNKFSEKVTFPDYGTVKLTLEDSGKPAQLEFESNKLANDALRLKLKADVSNVELNTKYEFDPVAISADVKYDASSNGDMTLVPGLVFARSGFLAGLSATVKPQASAGPVDNFSAGLQYEKNDYLAFLKFRQSLVAKDGANSVTLNGVYNLNSKTQLGLGADVKNLDKATDTFVGTLGGRYQFDKNLSVLAKIGTSGAANAALTHKINSDMEVSVVTEANVQAMQLTRTGVKLTLG